MTMKQSLLTLLFALGVGGALGGCTSGGRDYPKLVPADTILTDEPLTPSPEPALTAKADALRARAAALRAETP